MEALDDVAWAAETVLVAYGVRLGVRVDSSDSLAGLVAAIAPPGARVTRPGRVRRTYSVRVGDGPTEWGPRQHVGHVDSQEAIRSDSLVKVAEALAGDVRRFVAEHSTRRVFIHAGAVEWKGQAILVPGRSFTGKSTLVAALVSAGATYYSDEYAVLDDRGRLHPFVKPISLRDGSQRGIDHPPEDFGEVGEGPVPVGAVLLTRFRSGVRYQPRSTSAAVGAMALIDNALAARRRPRAVLAATSRASQSAVVLKGDRGDASAAARLLLRRLGAVAHRP